MSPWSEVLNGYHPSQRKKPSNIDLNMLKKTQDLKLYRTDTAILTTDKQEVPLYDIAQLVLYYVKMKAQTLFHMGNYCGSLRYKKKNECDIKQIKA